MAGEAASDYKSLLADAEATAARALERVRTEPDGVLTLRDTILLVLDVLGQLHDHGTLLDSVAVLQRIVSRSVDALHDGRQLIQTSKSKANPVLKALLTTLTTLADRPDAAPMEIFSALVQVVHTVCVTSMTSADVVQLFEFLRVSRTPVRRLVLQMQISLLAGETMPRAVFTMKGVHAGIIAPFTQMVFSKKGYSMSFGLHLDATASVVSLYSFRGNTGQGVSAMMEGATLVLRVHGANSTTSQAVVPFGESRSKMETAWVHVCIVHTKKMVFKDKVAVYVDGASIFSGNLPYPDPLCMGGGQNCVGVIPAVATGFQGCMWSPTLFGQPLSESDIQKLHWLTHWKNDLGSATAENTGLSDKSKFIFSYDARSCDFEKRLCFDISGNDCHGWMEPGTKAFVTQGIRQVMDAIGGSACFLLLLLDQIPELADFHPKQELTQDEISDLLAFVSLGLRTSVACRAHFLRLQGVNVLAFVVQSVSPRYLTIRVLDSVVGILESILKAVASPDDAEDYIQMLLFRNTNWFLSPFETQVKLLGETLPSYLKVLVELWSVRATGQKPSGLAAAASAMEALGIVAAAGGSGLSASVSSVSGRNIDASFFCNLLVQVYAPRLGFRGDDATDPSKSKSVKELVTLRHLIIHKLIGQLLFPTNPDDDLHQWRQLLAHIYHRCTKLTREAYDQEGDGTEVKEILSYLTGLLTNDPSTQQRAVMVSKLCKLSKGTLRLWWHAMQSRVPDIRLEALKLFEAFCTDKVVLKRRDVIVLLSAHQAYPIDLAASDALLNLIIGRHHASHHGTFGSPHRSLNVARTEFVPMVLLGLSIEADYDVQVRLLSEVKVLLASPSVGQAALEAIRSWPVWLSRLLELARRAAAANASSTQDLPPNASLGLSPQALNDACAALSDEHTPVTAKLDAMAAIGQAHDLRGCDFAISLLQGANQPSSVVKAIISTVQEQFRSRCPHLVSTIAKHVIVDVMVYSVLHVRNGWLHFLELYFCRYRQASDLCSLMVAVLERVVRRVAAPPKPSSVGSQGPVPPELIDFMWENLSQVASIVTLVPRMEEICDRGDGSALSPIEQSRLCSKAFDLWMLVLPRLHHINWEEMKSQLLQNAPIGDDIPLEDKEIFSHVVAASGHARFLALQTALRVMKFARENAEISATLVASVKKMFEVLRLVATPVRSPSSSSSASPPMSRASFSTPPLSAGVTEAFAAYIADAAAFFGESRSLKASLPREFVHLHMMDVLYSVLAGEIQAAKCFKTVLQLAEVVIAVAAAALRLQPLDETSAECTPADVTKSLQIIASTDLTFFGDIDQLQQLMMLWGVHHETHNVFVSGSSVETEVAVLNRPFETRWARVVATHSTEFNPYLIGRDAAIQANALVKEVTACESLWRELLQDVAVAQAALVDSMQDEDDKGLPSTLKQDAEKFASSVHKLITQSSRETRVLTAEDASLGSGLDSSTKAMTSEATDTSSPSECVVWKVSSRENGLRMRLRLKSVRENYRLRNASYECADASFHHEGERAGGRRHSLGPRRFKSARDNVGVAGGADEHHDRTWRSETGSDYSDFLADAHMRAAIIRSCPSVASERDSFSGDLSDDDDDDDDDLLLHAEPSDEPSDSGTMFDMETDDLLAPNQPHVVDSTVAPASSSPSPPPTPPPTPPTTTPPMSARVSGPSSPFGSLSTFGASLLSVVGGVTDVVTKAAKDAKDVVEFGVDSLKTARDVLAEDAQSFANEVSTALSEAAAKPDVLSSSPSSGGAETHSDRLTIRTTTKDTASSASAAATISETSDGPVLFPPSPPARAAKHEREADPRLKRHSSLGGGSSSKHEVEFEANLVRHMHVVAGKLVLTESHLRFVAERVIDEHETVLAERKKGVPMESAWRFLFKRRCWKMDDIASVNRRRYLLKPCALELFIHSTRKNYFFSLLMEDTVRFHEALMARRPLLLRRDPTMRRLRHPSSIFRNSNMSVRWMNHEISTFEYLMWLNTIAGRTYNDLTQYPVFPWVLADYESSSLDLTRASSFRDLSKPMGALDPARLKFFLDRYHAFEDADIPKFMYGTHYSNIGVVLFYLIRLEPFTSYALNVQGGKFDHADRLFHSVRETWNNCLHDFNDVKELTPEWFYLPEFLKNGNRLDLGARQSGAALGDVVLPPWASSPEDFVLKNFMALESEFVSANIHKWIDLIFGSSQRGAAAVEANNVFFYLTYEGMVDVDSITDPVTKSSMRAQIAHFGQTPTQVLRDPHPPRLSIGSKTTAYRRVSNATDPSSSQPMSPPPQALSSSRASPAFSDTTMTVVQLPHDVPIAMLYLVPGSSSMLCLDTNGHVSVHRYGTKCVKVHHTPFLNDLSTTATKASGVFKPGHAVGSPPSTAAASTPPGSASSSISTRAVADTASEAAGVPSEFIELQDRKSRKIVGEKRLVALDRRHHQSHAQTMVAFLNSGTVYCSVGHHDFSARFHSSTDGALLYRLLQHNAVVQCVGASANSSLLALGACDGTISVWKVAHIASTLLDSIKIFRSASKSARPVHANDYAADHVLLGHAATVNCVAVSDDLNLCVSGSVANECLVHDLADGSILQQLEIPGTHAPGVVSIALSPVGFVLVQSLGLGGAPMLYVFHVNGTLLATTSLDGDRPMTSISICTRFSRAIVSNADIALSFSLHSLRDRHVLLDKQAYGEISTQCVSPDETHVVFGVGAGKLVALSLLAHSCSPPAFPESTTTDP